MSHWIKLFSDGTEEKGSDTLIRRGKASWSKGRLASMIGTVLYFVGMTVKLEGTGPYWQKDIATSSYNLPPRRIARQIGRKIHEEDIGWALLNNSGPGIFTIRIAKEKPSLNTTRITKAHIGNYLVVTITTQKDIAITVEKKFHV